MKKIFFWVFILTGFFLQEAFSQQYNQEYLDSLDKVGSKPLLTRSSRFTIVGYSAAGFSAGKENVSFTGFSFNPILLFRPIEKVLVESELETELEGSETVINLEYINASYFLNKYMTIRAGKFLSPFGIFQDRLHPSWINKLPSNPLGYGHDGVGPSADLGVDVRGGIPLGVSKLNYSLYISNGPVLNVGEEEPGEEGQLIYETAEDNNKNKAIGGRLGFLPFSNSSLELGFSFQNAKPGDRNSEYKDVKASQYAADLTYVKQLDFIKGIIDVKAQWNYVNVSDVYYPDPQDTTGTGVYTFNNTRTSAYVQAAYKPTMLPGKILKKTELVFRYSQVQIPERDEEENIRQYTVGLNYWYTWRTALKIAYQFQENQNAFLAQVAVAF
ncbi:MAG: hypothetical protein K2X86_06215 [Cytophagaceae bacterium]|nr:hypothetical protein [Cytophagaceae bacterium]